VLDMSTNSKWLIVAAIFALCVAPTYISYQPYLFRWDDAEYLQQSVAVSRAFWSGNIHGLGAMVTIRPPVMTWLGLPWGSITSWDTVGRCFITLGAMISLLAALCLYLLLRIGVRPLVLVGASLCTVASLGPYPPSPIHWNATGFLADSLFAWTSMAAVLLIPYEARTPRLTSRGAVARGILWGLILSLGAMTKLNFFYFILFIVPTLYLIRLRIDGVRHACVAMIAFVCTSAPFAFYLARWGWPAFENAFNYSFGRRADFYYVPMLQFLGSVIGESPGLVFSFLLTVGGLIYLVIKRRSIPRGPDLFALLIMFGFGLIVLASHSRQIRYAFPAILALPFLIGILLSENEHSAPARPAALVAGLAFFGLLAASIPTGHRADRQSIVRADAIVAEAARCNAKRIVLATDSPTLNPPLIFLAMEFSPSVAPVELTAALGWRTVNGVPIEQDFHAIDEADEVVFQDKEKLAPPFTNQRVSEYKRHIRQAGYPSVRIMDDMTVYQIHCSP